MKKKEPAKVSVTEKALVQRINRALVPYEWILRKARPDSRMELEWGTFYAVGTRVGGVVDWRIDIEVLARELGVLKTYEQLA